MVFDDVPNNSFFSSGPAAKAGMQSVSSVPISFGWLPHRARFGPVRKNLRTPEHILSSTRIGSQRDAKGRFQMTIAVGFSKLSRSLRRHQNLRTQTTFSVG